MPPALGLLAALAACAAPGDEPLRLRVTGAGPGAFVVTAVLGEDAEGAPVARVACPAAADSAPGSRLACAADGALLAAPPATVHVTVKRRGCAFVSRALDVAGLPRVAGERVAELPLAELAPFETTADYATGLPGGEEGRAAFEALAHGADTELGPTRVVKFYIDRLADAEAGPRVYLQHTRRHPLHHEFVRKVLGDAVPLAEFEARTYRGAQRDALAGTLVQYVGVRGARSAALAGAAVEKPIAVTFFPSDDLTPIQAATAQRLLEERLGFAPLVGGTERVMYLPAGVAQEAQLAAARPQLVRRDAPWLLRSELAGNTALQLLNPGLSYGRLRRLSPEQLQTTVVSYRDILVLTRLPNSLPVVGGTITEELQTPLAHVNVSARARGTPNIALLAAGSDPRVAPLLGKLVRFEVGGGSFELRETTAAEVDAFWRARRGAPRRPAFDLTRADLPGFAELGFADSISVGAKAANLAELSRLLGARAPHGFAVPFAHYDRFMRDATLSVALCDAARDACTAGGRGADRCRRAHALCLPPAGSESLAQHVLRLLADPAFGADSELREAALANLRHLIVNAPQPAGALDAALDARVREVFGALKVRLRSSTNAEDLADFSGAGLYDSVSAYGDGAVDKRASRRVREVWASVWSWRAFEERGLWNIDHHAVRMGVAVNQAFSDEAANGVLITQNIADPLVAGMYVNVQRGELPVTNPEGGALPEVFSIIPAPPAGIQVARLRYSSLSPGAPLLSDAEIGALYAAAAAVQAHFAPLYGADPGTLALDLEFKLHGPARALFIKQARPYLQAGAAPGGTR